jgi:hypothetical protein
MAVAVHLLYEGGMRPETQGTGIDNNNGPGDDA